jgi:acetyltransferase-like isoleucine patch superfamily enzyme
MKAYFLALILNKFFRKCRLCAVKNSEVRDSAAIESGTNLINSSISRHSFCGYDCSIINASIGSFCSIASNVSIGGVAHPTHFVSTSPVFLSHKDSVKAKFANFHYLPVVKTTIGHDVWIGEGAYIKAGVTIGNGSVVGMGSIVTKDVLPYSIVAGNPARLIRMRFEPVIIEGLLKMQWWDLPESELKQLAPYFNNPAALLRQRGYI